MGPFHCGLPGLHLFRFHPNRRSFSRSYGSILPNSLTKVFSIALVFSTCLPVSVYGTGTAASTLRRFSRQYGLNHYTYKKAYPSSSVSPYGFPYRGLRPINSGAVQIHSTTGLPCCVPPSLHNDSAGILTYCPSPTPFGLGLGPTNPTRINLPSETLGLRR